MIIEKNKAPAQEGYAPLSGEIIGIFKQMLDEMMVNLKKEEDDESSEKSSYAINMKRIGEHGVMPPGRLLTLTSSKTRSTGLPWRPGSG